MSAQAARSATITVTTTADPSGASGTCSLRDAITAANTKTATNNCAAGTGADTIQFSVSGTISLGGGPLPDITDANLNITGPADSPGVTLDGGGIALSASDGPTTLIIANLTITHSFNSGISNNGGTLTVTNCTFSNNNAASGSGGGIFNNGGKVAVTNSTFSGNSALVSGGSGGGIYSNGTLIVTNSTFSGNSAPYGSAGGISSDGTMTVRSTILASSDGGNCGGSITDAGYNLSDDNSCAFSATGSQNSVTNLGIDPSLQSNGGPTETIALPANSPAVNAIPVNACTDVSGNRVATDQRGVARPQGSGCDIGAFEFNPSQGRPRS